LGPFFGAMLEPKLKAPFIWRSASCADNRGVNPVFSPARTRGPARAKGAAALSVLCLVLMGLPGAQASDDRDHERARAAVQAGEVLPLPTLLDKLQRTHPGQVLELELEREDGRWVYEVKLLQADGRLRKLALDARTGQVLELRRQRERRDERSREALR